MANGDRRGRTRLGAFLLVLVGGLWQAQAARAQFDNGPALPNNPFGDGLLFNSNISGFSPPRMPPAGTWAEVIMANSRWVVVQNAEGQQFPIAAENVQMFVVRWPMNLAAVTPDMLVEATGIQATSNQVRTDHLDIYAGSARSLVTPTAQSLQGFNPIVSPLGFGFQNVYGDINPFVAGEYGMVNRLHVVGPLLGLGPVRIAGGGNTTIFILPVTPAGFSVTQVTLGTASIARKGDLAFVAPLGATPRSLNVNQLVLYKKIPVNAFVE